METRCTDGSREPVLALLERETGTRAAYQFSPSFAYRVGDFTLLRDGRLVTEGDGTAMFALLAGLGLCEAPLPEPETPPGDFVYPMDGQNGRTLVNLVHLVSARQHLLNRALGVPGAFRITRELLEHLAAHPPVSRWDFLQRLSGWEEACRGLRFAPTQYSLPGFLRAQEGERFAFLRLADRMAAAAREQNRVKPCTVNARNKKYVMKTWMYAIGMDGPDNAAARAVLLARLPGTTAGRRLPGKEAEERG